MDINQIMASLEAKHPGESEYLQAVKEVLLSIQDIYNQHPEFEKASLIERLVEPDRIFTFKVPWVDDKGKVQVNLGYRVQFNNAIGPYKGGIRFHASVNLSILKFLGFEQTFKNALTTIAHLKQAFPQAGILIVGVGDREYKIEEGSLRTMPGIKNLIRYQQNLAADSGVAFWNMFEAMGGEGSMADMVHAKPSLANYDYTHINFRGGKHLAELLYEALVYGKEQYDRRRAYEAEP